MSSISGQSQRGPRILPVAGYRRRGPSSRTFANKTRSVVDIEKRNPDGSLSFSRFFRVTETTPSIVMVREMVIDRATRKPVLDALGQPKLVMKPKFVVDPLTGKLALDSETYDEDYDENVPRVSVSDGSDGEAEIPQAISPPRSISSDQEDAISPPRALLFDQEVEELLAFLTRPLSLSIDEDGEIPDIRGSKDASRMFGSVSSQSESSGSQAPASQSVLEEAAVRGMISASKKAEEPKVVESKAVEPKIVEPKAVAPKVVEPKVVEQAQWLSRIR